MIPLLRRPPPPLLFDAGPAPPLGPAPPADMPALIAVVRESGLNGVARRALLLRLSDLPADRTRPHHLRLAREALIPLTAADRARMFQLPNADLVVVWRGEAAEPLQRSLRAIRLLFADDIVLVPDPDALVELLELPGDAERLLRHARASEPPRDVGFDSASDALSDPPLVPSPRSRRPLDPATLARLETALTQTSVDRFTRRQQISLRVEAGFRLAWERRTLSVAELAETMIPDFDPWADPWLFRRLTRSLDRRMLSLLCAPEELRTAGPFSLDLNVAGLLAPEFLRFDTALPATLRGRVVLNLRPEDILIDPAAFVFARDFAHARGYRLLLSLTAASQLALLPLRRLGLDLLHLRWVPELEDAGIADLLPLPSAVVLGGADTLAALAWGQAHGIALYQGRLAAPRLRP